jgi:hypothetical protein
MTGRLSGEPYLSLHFRSSAGTIPANQDSGEIKLRFNRPDWSQFDQQGHYSFSPATDFADWERVTIYVDGNLVWGIEPGSGSTPATPTTSAETSPAATLEPQSTPSPPGLAESPPEQAGQTPAAGQAANESGLKTQPSLGLVIVLGLGVIVLSVARLLSRVRRD